jgi:phosphoenolpyruvate carboxykinase (ATP)
MIAKDKIIWQKDDYWGYEVPTEIPGVELERFQPESYYSEEQMERLSAELKSQRMDWLSQFPSLDKAILKTIEE